MEKMRVEEVLPIDDIDTFLSLIRRAKKSRLGRKVHSIARDESGSCTMHFSIPIGDKNEDEITTNDYHLSSFNKGLTYEEQEF